MLSGGTLRSCGLPGRHLALADGPTGRRARIAGTGPDVFELIFAYRALDEDWVRLMERCYWLSEAQLRAALTYVKTFPEEIIPIVEGMEHFDMEELYRKYPPARLYPDGLPWYTVPWLTPPSR